MRDWGMWKPGRTESRGAIEQMDAAGVTNLYVDAENTKKPEESLRVGFWLGEMDGKPVVQIDGAGDLRVNVNDGVVFDRHTDSDSMIYRAALAMFHNEVQFEDDRRHFSLEQMHTLRGELIQAGYPSDEVDGCGELEQLHCTTCDTVDSLEDGLCAGCMEQEQGAPE